MPLGAQKDCHKCLTSVNPLGPLGFDLLKLFGEPPMANDDPNMVKAKAQAALLVLGSDPHIREVTVTTEYAGTEKAAGNEDKKAIVRVVNPNSASVPADGLPQKDLEVIWDATEAAALKAAGGVCKADPTIELVKINFHDASGESPVQGTLSYPCALTNSADRSR
jgi:hypothetical protein